MEVKSKQDKVFPMLCGLLILVACCFRTAAVLKDLPAVPPPTTEPDSYLYLTEGRPAPEQGGSVTDPITMDISSVTVDNRCGAEFDKEALFQKDLSFTVTEDPCVLIIHTHGSEAYRDREDYRSEDPDRNVIRVGKEIADRLNAAGIPTIHDTTAHDVTEGYDLAYEEAAEAIASYLDKYPSIQMVVDVHRDAASDGQGGQKAVTAQLNGETVAGLLLVMGTDTVDLPHRHWQENLAFAMQLHSCLSGEAEGIMRPISLRGARYNEHFTPYSILLEVGAAGNSLEEALRSGEYFGNCLARLLHSIAENP